VKFSFWINAILGHTSEKRALLKNAVLRIFFVYFYPWLMIFQAFQHSLQRRTMIDLHNRKPTWELLALSF